MFENVIILFSYNVDKRFFLAGKLQNVMSTTYHIVNSENYNLIYKRIPSMGKMMYNDQFFIDR